MTIFQEQKKLFLNFLQSNNSETGYQNENLSPDRLSMLAPHHRVFPSGGGTGDNLHELCVPLLKYYFIPHIFVHYDKK